MSMKAVDKFCTINSISSCVQAAREDAELKKLCDGTILCNLYKDNDKLKKSSQTEDIIFQAPRDQYIN